MNREDLCSGTPRRSLRQLRTIDNASASFSVAPPRTCDSRFCSAEGIVPGGAGTPLVEARTLAAHASRIAASDPEKIVASALPAGRTTAS